MMPTSGFRQNLNWTGQEKHIACVNLALMDATLMNIGAAFRCAQRLLSANSATEFKNAVTNNARDQFEVLSCQIEELSAVLDPELDDLKLTFWE